MLYLLDTNICVALLRGHPAAIERLATTSPNLCAVSSISVYELRTGIEKCQRPKHEQQKVDHLLSSLRVIEFDRDAAERAAIVRVQLETAGTPIGPYDVLLAGHALALGLLLVTANVGEFSRVADLSIENWLA